jgi:glycosyltransferase involved in cell wall biosynthesis
VKKICYIATIPAVVNSFLRPHIRAAAEKYEVVVICNSVDKYLLEGINARIIFLPIERKPSIFMDVKILFLLINIFKREKFTIVHSHMPKTGFLGMFAAWLVCVPRRVNTFHGEIWATKKGWKRYALKSFDRLICFFSTDILLVSGSQYLFLQREGILTAKKAKLIGSGSVCGVDLSRFKKDDVTCASVRNELGISSEAKVILFMGRLSHDKGILELAKVFSKIINKGFDAQLLIVGSEEDVNYEKVRYFAGSASNRLHYVSFTTRAERYMAAADILCLPSRREGFGMVIIEAAACCVPTVASRIYGITDAVDDGKTGLLYQVDNNNDLESSLLKLILDNNLRIDMGVKARQRVEACFSEKFITNELIDFYDSISI